MSGLDDFHSVVEEAHHNGQVDSILISSRYLLRFVALAEEVEGQIEEAYSQSCAELPETAHEDGVVMVVALKTAVGRSRSAVLT